MYGADPAPERDPQKNKFNKSQKGNPGSVSVCQNSSSQNSWDILWVSGDGLVAAGVHQELRPLL